jgi:SagB-type dehydrogenase family enzyme
LYPLEVYIVLREGVYHYEPATHQLRVHSAGDMRPPLFAACLAQEAVKLAPIALVIAAVDERLAVKYGDRAPRYAHIEAGHVAQNVLLQAVALNLGAVPIGAFDDAQVQRVLALSADQQPLYVIPVGRRK